MDESQHHRQEHPEPLLQTLERLLSIDVTDRHTALMQMSQLLTEAFGADKVDIMLYQEDICSLVALGTSDTPMGHHQLALGLDRLPLANGGREADVYITGAPHLTGHADQDPKEIVGLTEGLGIRSSMVVPLEVDGARRGVVLASAKAPERFGQRELALFEAVARWVGVVTHRAELVEQNREQAREQGRRMVADELVTVVAHDLRNYLTPLKARVDLLHRRALRRKSQRDVRDAEVAVREIERLSRLITNLLDVSRIEQGLFALELRPVDLVALMQELADSLTVPLTPIQVRLPAQMDELVVIADGDRLRQALENLLANALRHAPPETPITLALDLRAAPGDTEDGEETPLSPAATPDSWEQCSPGDTPPNDTRDHQWAVLTVADRGPGIPSDVLPRLFTRFAAGASSPGLGLGLYLAHEIARAHGGRLAVDSAPGKGARFSLILPVDGPWIPEQP